MSTHKKCHVLQIFTLHHFIRICSDTICYIYRHAVVESEPLTEEWRQRRKIPRLVQNTKTSPWAEAGLPYLKIIQLSFRGEPRKAGHCDSYGRVVCPVNWGKQGWKTTWEGKGRACILFALNKCKYVMSRLLSALSNLDLYLLLRYFPDLAGVEILTFVAI